MAKRQRKKRTPRHRNGPLEDGRGRHRNGPLEDGGARQQQEEESRQFEWVPLWGWILIFLGPLALSEFMFYKAGRSFSMVLFPVAWIGFWFAMMHRSGWPILKKRNEKQEDESK